MFREVLAGAALGAAALLAGCGSPPQAAQDAPAAAQQAAPAAVADVASLAGKSRLVDLTVLISETLPANSTGFPPFQRWSLNWYEEKRNDYGSVSAPSVAPYYYQRYILDEHMGTQVDFPAHFIPPPDSNLPNAGPNGLMTGERYPLEKLMGPAAVIDVTNLRDQGENGKSAVITVDMLKQWEAEHGAIQAGDVVLFYSGYTNAYYKPFPEGKRLTADPIVAKSTPGWPAPEPAMMEYLHQKGVWHLGIDSPSMGHTEEGIANHIAGLKLGMSWTEMLINLDQLPARGAYYQVLPPKIIDQGGSSARAIAFVPLQP
jgi:kynurenine formamidase